MQKSYLKYLFVPAIALAFISFAPSFAKADSVGPINFEAPAYTVGTINGQQGWSSTGAYDQGVVSSPVISGSQSFRISNAVTSGSFGDQTFAPALTQAAGETGSNNGTFGSGPFQSHFESQFTIEAIPNSIGDTLSVSPDRGDGSRMSYLRFDNEADGIHVYFDDVQGTTNPANFVETALPTLDSSVPHTVKFSMDFADGPSNDVVNIYIDGNLVHTGTSWENYYRYDSESNPNPANPDTTFTPTVRTTLFRESGTAVPANSGKGFLIDDLSQMSGPTAPTVFVTTNTATGVTATDATLNGTNGTSAAVGHSFWVSTSPFSTSSPTIPSGVYSTPDMGAIAANTAWSATLSSLTTSGVPSNMPAVAANTTYYFVAWSNVGGTWYPGAELHFTTAPNPVTSGPTDKDQCKDNGWMSFTNPSFKNQGQCVSSVVSHK